MADWRLAVDIGGTFTDVVLLDAGSRMVLTEKTLATPGDPLTGLRRGVETLLHRSGVDAISTGASVALMPAFSGSSFMEQAVQLPGSASEESRQLLVLVH